MLIDWNRYIAWNLPIVMRQPRIYHLLRSLLSAFVALHDRAQTWRVESLRRARYDSSPIMIERMILDEMGLIVSVEDLDTGSSDFRVRVLSADKTYDEARLRALINKYKPADKRYMIGDGNVSYTVIYQDYACEKTDERFSVEYTSYVCETHDYIETVTIYLYGRRNDGDVEIFISTGGQNVASTIKAQMSVGWPFYINAGQQESEKYTFAEESDFKILSISPTKDSTYIYRFEADIIWLT